MDDLEQAIAEATREDLEVWLRADEAICDEYKRVLDALPPCPVHGAGCIPGALGAIEALKRVVVAAREFLFSCELLGSWDEEKRQRLLKALTAFEELEDAE